MVKILSNGDIVPDNDPRAQGTSNRSSETPPRQRHGGIQHEENAQPHYHMPQGSVFDGLNQRLLDAGLPRWNIFQYTVEPIASVGFLLALLFLGFPGLIFAGLLFFVVKYSGSSGGSTAARPDGSGGDFRPGLGRGGGPPGDGPGGSGGGSRRGWRAGGGYRLGR